MDSIPTSVSQYSSVILKFIFIWKKAHIFPGSRMEVIDVRSSIIFEDDISVGQNLHIISGGKLIIKTKTTISLNFLITNVNHEYHEIDKYVLLQSYIVKDTIIGQNCFIG